MSPKLPGTTNLVLTRSRKEYKLIIATLKSTTIEKTIPPLKKARPRKRMPVPTNDLSNIKTACVTVASPRCSPMLARFFAIRARVSVRFNNGVRSSACLDARVPSGIPRSAASRAASSSSASSVSSSSSISSRSSCETKHPVSVPCRHSSKIIDYTTHTAEMAIQRQEIDKAVGNAK